MSAINIAKDTIQVVATRVLQLLVGGLPALSLDSDLNATFAGDVTATGDVAGVNGTFSGDVSADNVTATGDVTGANVSTAGDVALAADSILLFGADATDGSWRITRSGNDLLIQRFDTNTWTTKQTIAAV
jgi:hypothetical protein